MTTPDGCNDDVVAGPARDVPADGAPGPGGPAPGGDGTPGAGTAEVEDHCGDPGVPSGAASGEPPFDGAALDRLARIVERHTSEGMVPGLAWAVSRRGQVRTGAAGTLGREVGSAPVDERSLFRIASLTKPILAAATLVLAEQCRLRLDDPVETWLPELAEPRVLVEPAGPLDRAVPADRSITVRDLLTFRMGLGYDFGAIGPQPVIDALAAGGYPVGPPRPQDLPGPERFLDLVGSLPLSHQPGTRWLYHLSAEVLGVLLTRVTGLSLDQTLRDLVLDPLGMDDTAFWVPPGKRDRFGPCYGVDPGDDVDHRPASFVFDDTDGHWTRPPPFASGGGGLVSTVSDLLRFASALLGGGRLGPTRILSRPSVEAMTMDHLTDEQRLTSSPDPSGTVGWGFGVGVRVRRIGPTETAGSYGWTGGLGASWTNDPGEDLVAVLLTNEMFSGPFLPPVHHDFLTAAYAAIGD